MTDAPEASPQPPSGQPAPLVLVSTETGIAETEEPQPQLAAQAVAWQPVEQVLQPVEQVLQPVEQVLQPVEQVLQQVVQQRLRRSEIRRVGQQVLQLPQFDSQPQEVSQLATAHTGAATCTAVSQPQLTGAT
jgi:hypothetical protein